MPWFLHLCALLDSGGSFLICVSFWIVTMFTCYKTAKRYTRIWCKSKVSLPPVFIHPVLRCQSLRSFFVSVKFSGSVMSDSLWPHGLQHASLLCPSPTLRACSNSCPLSWWCHPTISSSVVPFSSCPQSFLASGSFQMSQFFASGGWILELQLQHQSFQWIFRADFLICLTSSFYPHISN